MPHTIAILGGTGAEGFGLALRFAVAGAHVIVGSREAARAEETARTIASLAPGSRVEGRVNSEAAAAAAGIVILTVPLQAQIATLESVRSSLRPGAVLVDTTVPLEAAIGGKRSRHLALWAGSAAEQAAQHVDAGVHVVAAFHSLSAGLLARIESPLDSDVLLCGNSAEAKSLVSELVAMLPGARPVDAGPLENARLLESLAALLISLNLRRRGKHAGVRITGLDAPG